MVTSKIAKGIKSYFTDILAQTFSPSGDYLAVASVYGEVCVFNIEAALNPPDDNPSSGQFPFLTFRVNNGRGAFSLLSTDKFLVVGSLSKVYGFEWKSIIAGKPPKISWSWEIPADRQSIEGVEVNAMAGSQSGAVYAGCSDNKIHVFSLEDGRYVRSFAGHEDYIHDVKLLDDETLASASEDGRIKFWDLRSSKFRNQFEPWKTDSLARPIVGKWVGSIYSDKQWLLSAGGVKAGLWHLPSSQLMAAFETEESGIHACMIHEERVIVGNRFKVSQFTLLGDPIGEISCSSPTQLSLTYRESPSMLLALSGNSPNVDLCTNFDYRNQTVSIC